MGLLRTALDDLGLEPEAADTTPLETPVPLDAELPVGRLAEEAVRFAAIAARRLGIPPAPLDGARIATSFSSERCFQLNGSTPDAWAPLSGFWATADGWVRTHANYPHHRNALLRSLDIAEGDDQLEKALVRQALATTTSLEAENIIVAAGGVAAAMRTSAEWNAHPHGRGVPAQPLLRIEARPGSAAHAGRHPSGGRVRTPPGNSARPLERVRVLDLTRVLAGPVCCRTLSLWGAEVLRIDPPFLPEPEWIHFETGAGKRSALLDLRSDRDRFRQLLRGADVLVHGYRPGALRALGLEDLISDAPGLVVASLSAWGAGPWGERRGFDSIVQAASGIAAAESPDGARPGALPAQALDHSAGYLLAGAVAQLLQRRAHHGGGWSVEVSLARIASELLALPREARRPGIRFAPTVSTAKTAAGSITQALPALGTEGYRFPPRRFGADQPAWPSRTDG
jgi:crotonobetainyl-CoA:carnitine CoA-transferase CaiB-like acyl-CoA transferase